MNARRSNQRRWRSTAVLIVFAAMLAVSIAPAMASALTCDCGDICVNETGWWRNNSAFNANTTTPIQAAVDNAADGEMICVRAGDYSENVDVNKQVTLAGEGAGVVTVTAVNPVDHVFDVTADHVNISGFTATGAMGYPFAGIHLTSADCNISGNAAPNNLFGIYLQSSSNNALLNNTANSNTYGIYLESSSNNALLNNIANSSAYYGIYLESSSNNAITNNIANSNTDYGIYLRSSSNNAITNNVADLNNHGIYLYVSSNYNAITNNTADLNNHGIYLKSSSNNALLNNTASNNSQRGIYVQSSSNNALTNNVADLNNYGIALSSSSSNTLTNNIADSNTNYGIHLTSSGSNTLTNNTAGLNNYGICLYSSSSNTLLNNTMSGNDYNFGVSGYSLPNYEQNIGTSNTVDGKPIYYRVGRQDESIPLDAGYVGIVNGTNITVTNLTLTNNLQGVLFAYTENSRIETVTAESNNYGIYLYSSSNNTFVNNTADSNTYGIYLEDSSSNTPMNNTADSNTYGIYLEDSSSNTLMNNTADSNTEYGIYLYFSSSNTLQNNTADSNTEYGIYLYSSSNNALQNNTADSNTYGIYLDDSSSNTLMSNTASDNSNWDIYIKNSPSTLTDNTLNGTTVSFTYSGDVSLKGVGSPDVDPFGRHNISKFISATNQSAGAWLYLNFSYSDSDLTGNIVESSLTVWRHNGTAWAKDGWGDGHYSNATGDVAGVNITSFSVFAPMGVLPLQCINLTPGLPQTLNLTKSQEFIATGYDQDGAEISEYFVFEWAISDAYIGSLTPVNDTATNFTADHMGITYLTASNGGLKSDPVQVTVKAATNNTTVKNKKKFKVKSGNAAATGNFKNNVSGWICATARGNDIQSRSRSGLGSGDRVVSGVAVNVSDDIRRALAVGNGTIRIEICYNKTRLNALGINANTLAIWKYDSTTGKWVKQPSTGSKKCFHVDVDHLCNFSLISSNAKPSRGVGSSRKGKYPPGLLRTPAPTVTAKKAPAASTGRGATEAPPDEHVKSTKKKPAAARAPASAAEGTTAGTDGAPGFPAVFAIAGMFAVAYAMMRRRE